MEAAYQRIKSNTLSNNVLLADETPHRMLEGDPRSNWYLWSFSSHRSCFYECHDTRAGAVATNILLQSNCSYLLTDLYSGYQKAVREANKVRTDENRPLISMALCNSHARRQFKEIEKYPEASFMVKKYQYIYGLEAKAELDSARAAELRSEMLPHFEEMLSFCKEIKSGFSSKSDMTRAIDYFVDNYDELTLFINHPDIPIDNNSSERLLYGG